MFSLVIQEERQKNIGTSPSSSAIEPIFFASNSSASLGNYDPSKTQKDKVFCTHWRMNGHSVDKCYKIHGYPPSFKPKNMNQSQSS